MRIAYLGQMADVSTENGISKKIVSQTRHWAQAGHEVRYFSLVPTLAVWSGLVPLKPQLVERGHLIQRVFRSLELARQIRAWQPDVIYFRYGYHSAGLPELFRAVPTVAEINSDDLAEYPTTLSAAKFAYHRMTRQRVLKRVAGFVTVTHELAQRFGHFGKATAVIANGINLDEFRVAPPPNHDAPRLIFIGNTGSPWHGLERIFELAETLPNVAIDIVGWTERQWRQMTESSKATPDTVRFHGPLIRDHYEPLLSAATAAIGTLALFKNRMDEACPLKVREYLAFGLPVIAAYQDTDIPAHADYFFRLPNNATPVALQRDKIMAWLARWRGQRVPRSAVAHLDNGSKEARRLQFLMQFASRREHGA